MRLPLRLAGLFSSFYEHCPILSAEQDAQKQSRLRLAALTGRTSNRAWNSRPGTTGAHVSGSKEESRTKRGASRYRAPAKQTVPGWIWLVCGLVIGGFIMFLMSLEPGGEEVKRARKHPRPP